MPNTTTIPSNDKLLRAVGFCGVDESVTPLALAGYSCEHPWIEWGVLFRPDKEGTPRYPSMKWVQQLGDVKKKNNIDMRLAAHLCGERANELLRGEKGFIQQLQEWGFGRVQLNPTAINGVDTSNLAGATRFVLEVTEQFPALEFIIQKNDETEPLWRSMLDEETLSPKGRLPFNISMLLDESKGTGVLPSFWPVPPSDYKIGYAGGLGPVTIADALPKILRAAKAASIESIWIDMESGVRSTWECNNNTIDIFDIKKCFQVIEAICHHHQVL